MLQSLYMKQTKRPLVVGNWKLNPATAAAAKELFIDVRKAAKTAGKKAVVVVAPPFPFLGELAKLTPSGSVGLAAQDVFYENKGAFTGEVAPSMLASLGVQYVIVGHSERRAMGESDATVAKKAAAALKAKLTPIVCIGESKRDSHGHFYSFVAKELKQSLSGISKQQAGKLVIAYEPIWAIGTGKHATPEDVEEMQLFIKKELTKIYGRNVAHKIPVLYGGSVKPKNAAELYEKGQVNGFLVGGASLRGRDFSEIIKACV